MKKPIKKSAKCQFNLTTDITPKNIRKNGGRIPMNNHDKRAAEILDDIRDGIIEAVRPAIKIPLPWYPHVKFIIALKHQSFLEYTLALILENLEKYEKLGLLGPLPKNS